MDKVTDAASKTKEMLARATGGGRGLFPTRSSPRQQVQLQEKITENKKGSGVPICHFFVGQTNCSLHIIVYNIKCYIILTVHGHYIGVSQGNIVLFPIRSSPRKHVQLQRKMTAKPQGIHNTYMLLLLLKNLYLLMINDKIYHMIGVSGRIPSPVHDLQEEAATIEPTVPEIPSPVNSTGSNFLDYQQVCFIDTIFIC